MKKKIGAIICLMLLIPITTSIVSGQDIKDVKCVSYKLKIKNNPPKDPIITAPENVIKNKVFITKIMSTDPNGDKIFYRFKIGEEGKPHKWQGPFESGYEFKLRIRILFYTGDLTFGFQSKDENGATSEWAYHKVTYINSHSYNIIENTLLRFLQRLLYIIN